MVSWIRKHSDLVVIALGSIGLMLIVSLLLVRSAKDPNSPLRIYEKPDGTLGWEYIVWQSSPSADSSAAAERQDDVELYPDNSPAYSFMVADDGAIYWTINEQTLGEAVDAKQVASYRFQGTYFVPALQEPEGAGKCYRDDVDIPEDEREKNDWKTPCSCHQQTQCDPNAGEGASCKRHCRRSDCDCCAI